MKYDSTICIKLVSLLLVVVSLSSCGKSQQSTQRTVFQGKGKKEVTIRVEGIENFSYSFDAGSDRIFYCNV
jgi:ABC-type Fe3+-citrate transport system substrate-binding protein